MNKLFSNTTKPPYLWCPMCPNILLFLQRGSVPNIHFFCVPGPSCHTVSASDGALKAYASVYSCNRQCRCSIIKQLDDGSFKLFIKHAIKALANIWKDPLDTGTIGYNTVMNICCKCFYLLRVYIFLIFRFAFQTIDRSLVLNTFLIPAFCGYKIS